MTPAAWIALGSLAVVVLAHLAGAIVWLTMLEMRVRATERATDEFWKIRDTVMAMEGHLKSLVNDMEALMQQFNTRPPGYEIAPGASRPTRPRG